MENREAIAAQILSGILANPTTVNYETAVEQAVKAADLLLIELAKK